MTAVTVVGGGITGLAAAWELVQRGASVTLLEGGPRLGGKIETIDVDGVAVEAGADAFLARVPWATDLCRELGLEEELVSPAVSRALVWSRGRLRPLPEQMLLGVPTDVLGVARSGLLSPLGLGRAACDLVLPRSTIADDVSVASLVGRRLGRQVVERLVDPLVGGINAGRTEDLSAAAVAPQVLAAARSHRSIVLGARRQRVGANGPVFLTVRAGLGRLVERLAASLRANGAAIHTDAPVASLDELGPRVVLAVPAAAAASLVRPRSPRAADELDAIEYASVTLVTFAYEDEAVPALDASGFLVPRREGRLMTACSFGTSKWPQWAPPGQAVLRVSAGRAGDDRVMHMGAQEVVERLHDELVAAVGISAVPTSARVHRWESAFPQYRVGHLDRVGRIERALAEDAPTVVVAGAAYRGLGIPACIEQGRAAARATCD